MREFFRPWKRKLGVVTLLLACAITAVWIRSLGVSDSVFYPANSRLPPRYNDVSVQDSSGNDMTVGIWSGHGCIAVEYALDSVLSQTMIDFGEPLYVHRLGFGHPSTSMFQQCEGEWIWGACGFGKAESRDSLMFTTVWVVPYWSIVLPLTAFTVWLLFSKSALRKPFTSQPDGVPV